MYYNAKNIKDHDPDGAIRELKAVVDAEKEKGDWGFKALKQQTKINFHRGRHAEALDSYTRLLSYTKSAVTRNYSEKSINNILDYVSNATDVGLAEMQSFYDVTKSALEDAKNERLSVKTDLKLARIWLARKEWNGSPSRSRSCAPTAPATTAPTTNPRAPSFSRCLRSRFRCMAKWATSRSSKRSTIRRCRSRVPSRTRVSWA